MGARVYLIKGLGLGLRRCDVIFSRTFVGGHIGNEEYKGRNRHNVECFLERVLYFGWPNQPSSGTMENFASGRVFM